MSDHTIVRGTRTEIVSDLFGKQLVEYNYNPKLSQPFCHSWYNDRYKFTYMVDTTRYNLFFVVERDKEVVALWQIYGLKLYVYKD